MESGSQTPLDGAYSNALLFAHWSVGQKLNRVSLVQFSYVALYAPCSMLTFCTHWRSFFLRYHCAYGGMELHKSAMTICICRRLFYDRFMTFTRVCLYSLQGAAKKVDPWSFSPFSQQPFGILIWNSTAFYWNFLHLTAKWNVILLKNDKVIDFKHDRLPIFQHSKMFKLKMLFNFQTLVTRYCRWRHSDVLINSNLYC